MRIFIGGIEIIGFTEAEVSRSLDTFCGQFMISLTAILGKNLPIKRHEKIEVKTNNVTILTGFIEKIDINYASDYHEILIRGRDKTCDIIDSTVDGSFEFNPPTSLTSVIEKLLSYHNITGISVINKAGNLKNFSQGDQISGELGSSLFSVIESYCRLRQVLPVTNADGNIELIQTTTPAASGETLVHKKDNESNNILSASASYDETQRFYKYIGHSQGNSSALSEIDQDPSEISSRKSEAFDEKVRTSRQYNFQAERAATVSDLTDRVKWETNIRRSRSSSYSCTLRSFVKPKAKTPWLLHEKVTVIDEFANISAELLICGIRFSYGLSGSTTELDLCTKDAYSLQAEQSAREERANIQGKDL